MAELRGGLPSTVPGFFVQAVAAALQAEGVDLAALEVAAVAPGARSEPGVPGLQFADFQAPLESACRVANNPHLGMQVGKRITEANLHVLGPVIVASPSLRTIAELMSGLQVAVFGQSLWAFIEEGPDYAIYSTVHELRSRALTEMLLALAFCCARRFLGEPLARELAVQLAFERPADPTPYKRVFGGAVAFRAERTGIRFPHALLEVERPGTDAGLAQMLCELAKERFPVGPSRSWAQRVEHALREHERLAHVDIESIAAAWQLTGRSLRRRLEHEGARFNDVLNRIRYERACQLLRRGSTPIARIASTLGYSDSSAFQRAFKRWAGVGPAEYRMRERARRP